MLCPQIDELRALRAGALPSQRAREVDEHVAGCDFCRENLSVLQAREPVVAAADREVTAEAPARAERSAPAGTARTTRRGPQQLVLPLSLLAGLMIVSFGWWNASRRNARLERRIAEAERELELARNDRRAARQRESHLLSLSDTSQLQRLADEADRLWPAYPERIDELRDWLVEAEAIAQRLPGHEQALARLRERASDIPVDTLPSDPTLSPIEREIASKAQRVRELERQLEHITSWDIVRETTRTITKLKDEIAALESGLDRERKYFFDSWELQWEHDAVESLVVALRRFADPETGQVADVRARLAFARRLAEWRASSSPQAARWQLAIATIADPAQSPLYDGLVLSPQTGLLPLGPDPQSGLWEFVHVQTGREPERNEFTGALEIDDDTGLVFVLVPASRFVMGAQKQRPDSPNFDALSQVDETLHNAQVDSFLLSKYEMTQAQWRRFTAHDPSAHSHFGDAEGLDIGPRHPVENVSWYDCDETLAQLGLRLPTEAEWELAARGGTTAAWWTGPERESLKSVANIADMSAKNAGARWPAIDDWPENDDGFFVHAPVNAFGPNPFGFHGQLGNVREWCRDAYDTHGDSAATFVARYRSARGGHFKASSSEARMSNRAYYPPQSAAETLGVRPARSLER